MTTWGTHHIAHHEPRLFMLEPDKLVVCQPHLDELWKTWAASFSRAAEGRSAQPLLVGEQVTPDRGQCIMCVTEPIPGGRECNRDRCGTVLHPRWPGVYCCHHCALLDVHD